MKISHESPLALLEESRNYNDYDYALVHLFEEIPYYYEFFKESLKMGRTVFLDNSIFELGVAFDSDTFLEYVEELNAINSENFYYIIPDVLEEKDETIKQFKEFRAKYDKGNTIGVVQGKNFNQVVDCFKFMKENADIVAISFNYSYYERMYSELPTEHAWMRGRIHLIDYLDKSGLLRDTKVHLLGCGLPQEFSYYRQPELYSLDTSNPVVHGILGIEYGEKGLDEKKSTKLVDLIDYTSDDYSLIYNNIKAFRELVN